MPSTAQTDAAVAFSDTVAIGPKKMPMPGGSPAMVAVKGPLPPGAKIIKGPPPNSVMKVIAKGGGSLAVSRRGSASSARARSPSPPLGVRLMGKSPPGVKIITGPPPPGMKAVHATPPSNWNGNKLMQPVVMEETQMKGLPPGVKLVNGPPPRGLGAISPDAARHGARSPSMLHPQPASPTNLSIFRMLPNGVKVLVTPPPGRSPVKIVTKSPPMHPSPSPPVMLTKMHAKSMAESNAGGSHAAVTSRSTTPLIPLHNESFSLGSKSLSAPNQQLPKPIPLRPGGTIVTADGALVDEFPDHSQRTLKSKVHPTMRHLDGLKHESKKSTIAKEPSLGDSSSDEIEFEVATPLTPLQAPRASTVTEKLPKTSSSSPSSRKDADDATVAPPGKTTESRDGAAPLRSSTSSSSAAGAAPPTSSTKTPQEHYPAGSRESKSTKKKRRGHRTSSHDDIDREGEASEKERRKRKHRRRHHRPRSSEPREAVSRRSESLQSLKMLEADPSDSPVPVDETRRRTPSHRNASSEKKKDLQNTSDELLGGQSLTEAAFTDQALTSTLRARIAENFLSMLCPQQYYGKVHRISRIRPFKADRFSTSGLRGSNSIYVATKGVMPNPYFYPQLRLRDTDGDKQTTIPGAEHLAEGFVSTPIILYEAAPGNMLFADTELDARRLLESNPTFNSCFMLSNSAILFRDPQRYVLPIASLSVLWVPYSSPQSEPQCPVHKRELQLFDPYSKELVCALCASRNGIPMTNFVVIPDVLGNADSRRTIQETVCVQLDEAQQSSKRWVDQHQRVGELCENKKDAIRNQFDLLIGALEAKKKEYIEACEAEFAYAQTNVAREILITDERIQLLRASSDHLRTEPTKSLFSMQIATIAESLSAGTDLPSRFTRASLQLPPMSMGLVPNLEGIMTQVLRLSPQVSTSGSGGTEAHEEGPSAATSPHRIRSNPTLFKSQRTLENPLSISNGGRRRSTRKGSAAAASPKLSHSASPNVNHFPLHRSVSLLSSTAARHPHSAGHVESQEKKMNTYASFNRRSTIGDAAPAEYSTDALSVPNSTGTSMFDFPLQDLLCAFGTSNMKRRSPRYVQWAIRVEDPGDWVGLGVGVGSTIEAWEQGSTNDLSHLWIVPTSMKDQVLYLRVVVNAGSGHAKLRVHDARGRQLDSDEVPQWNANRPSYPQATFGGLIGTVRMVEIPHFVY